PGEEGCSQEGTGQESRHRQEGPGNEDGGEEGSPEKRRQEISPGYPDRPSQPWHTRKEQAVPRTAANRAHSVWAFRSTEASQLSPATSSSASAEPAITPVPT